MRDLAAKPPPNFIILRRASFCKNAPKSVFNDRYNIKVLNMACVPVFPGSQVFRMACVPVFPGSLVIKLAYVSVFPGSKLNQNGLFSNIFLILNNSDWISILK